LIIIENEVLENRNLDQEKWNGVMNEISRINLLLNGGVHGLKEVIIKKIANGFAQFEKQFLKLGNRMERRKLERVVEYKNNERNFHEMKEKYERINQVVVNEASMVKGGIMILNNNMLNSFEDLKVRMNVIENGTKNISNFINLMNEEYNIVISLLHNGNEKKENQKSIY
jgi:hypothetical protein